MNIEELEEALEDIIPGYRIDKDKSGQLVIYTGHTEEEDGELVELQLDSEDDDDLDEDFDMDHEPYLEDDSDD